MPWLNVAALPGTDPTMRGTVLFGEPPGTTARTFPRDRSTAYGAPNSGTVYMRQIDLPAGYTANARTASVGVIAKLGGTHGWYVVTDMNMNVLAVTADQTDAATVWGTVSMPYSLPFTSTLACPYTGYYYVGLCVVATTMPVFVNSGLLIPGISAIPPVLCGNGSTGQTTPPAIGSQLAAPTGSSGSSLYILLSG
jgi:hypothetical protein